MITIKSLIKEAHLGQRYGGVTLNIKTRKKTWQVGDAWWRQVVVMDETGEMPADINLGKCKESCSPANLASKLINCLIEVQSAEYLGKDRRKIVVEQFEYEKAPSEPPLSNFDKYNMGLEPPEIVRGKIRHWLVCSILQSGKVFNCSDADKAYINKLTDFIEKGI